MKFTERKFPFLKTIKSGGLTKYEMGKPDLTNDEVIAYSNRINDIINGCETFYLSDKILNHIKNDTFNLGSKMAELINLGFNTKGVFIFNDGLTYVYSLQSKGGLVAYELYQLCLSNILASIHTGTLNGLNMKSSMITCKIENLASYSIIDAKVVGSLLSYLIFKEYAPIETLIVNREKTRKGVLNKEKYLNEFNHNVTVIDSNWFTNIIRNKGFGVRGHFGLRAYGEGRKKRKLVWIESYKKNGYVKKAKKNLHN